MATIPATATATTTTTRCSTPPLPTIAPPLRIHHPCQQPPSSSFSSVRLGSGLAFGDSVGVEEAVEKLAVERSAEKVVQEAMKWGFHGVGVEKMRKRRRRKRRRRRGFECLDVEDDEEICGEEVDDKKGASLGPFRSGFLSPEEEAELCLCLKEGAKLETLESRVAEAQHNEVTSGWLSSGRRKKKTDTFEILYRRREAQEKLTRCYRRFVVSIASGYQGKGLNLQDLIQEGTMGLLRGAEKFDPARGNKLSTYVYWWIKQAILRAVAHKSRLVRLPGSMREVMAKVAEASNVLSGTLRSTPTCEEIADEVNLHVSAVRLALDRSCSPVSLDRAASDNGRMTLQDIIQGPDETTPEYMEKRQRMRQEVEKLLETLTAREYRVLRLYFGLKGETPMSFEEIGKSMKLSRERVRQINGIALSKLQNVHNVNDLKMYIV